MKSLNNLRILNESNLVEPLTTLIKENTQKCRRIDYYCPKCQHWYVMYRNSTCQRHYEKCNGKVKK